MPTPTITPRVVASMTAAAARLGDDELATEIARMRRCALCMTRSRRDLARLQIHCLECEMERRADERAHLAGRS